MPQGVFVPVGGMKIREDENNVRCDFKADS